MSVVALPVMQAANHLGPRICCARFCLLAFLELAGNVDLIDAAGLGPLLFCLSTTDDNGVCKDGSGLELELVIIMLGLPADMIDATDEAAVTPVVDDPERVPIPDSTAAKGTVPSIGVVAAANDPISRQMGADLL